MLATSKTLGDVLIETVREGSDTQNEIQKITLVNANGGFFVLAFEGETTDPISLGTLVNPVAATAAKRRPWSAWTIWGRRSRR